MRRIKQISFIILATTLCACSYKEEKEDEVKNVDKKASIETELSVQHAGTSDILITRHKIWKNHKLFREIVKRDTLPALGDSLQMVEDENGNEHHALVKKDYEFYITVQ